MASFNAEEKNFLNSFFEKKSDEETIEKYLPDAVFDFLKRNAHLKTIKDRILFKDANAYRVFSTCTITKFILPDMNLTELITDICEILSPDYLLFLDFHFLIEIPTSNEEDPSEEVVYKFQRGSKTSSFNDIIKITNSNDLDKLLSSIENFSNADFLNEAFIAHSELFQYRGSGLRPYSLLSLLLHLQKIN